MTSGATINFNAAGNGLDITTTTGTGFNATGGGNINVQGTGNSITAGTGNAMNLSGVAVGTNGIQFATISSTNAATGISINAVGQQAGSTGIDVLGGSIVNAGTRGVDIAGSTADISIATAISTSATGRSVEVTDSGRNVAGGSQIVFSGAIDDNGLGINLDNNDQNTQGAVVTFSGGLDIDTAGANIGFNATNGGTVNVTGSNNSINSTNATALNIANTTIGASNVTFHDISSGNNDAGADPASGIILNTTGASGSLIVTGDGNTSLGGNNSGGTVQNTTSHGISLASTLSPSFTNMNIQTTGGQGIDGTGVTNFTFANGKINNAGDASAENSINFASSSTSANVTGVVSITNNQITNTEAEGIRIVNFTGNLSNVVISGNTLSDTNDLATPGSAVVININAVAPGNAASLTMATLSNNTITTFRAGAGFVVQANSDATGTASMTLGTAGSATNVINVTGNLMDGGNFGIGNQPDRFFTGGVNGTGTGNFNISNNGTALAPIKNIDGVVIELTAFGPANVTSTINNNWINANNAVSSSGIGVGLTTDSFPTADNGTFTTTISGNNISNTNGQGIFVVANADGNTGTVNAHILNNTISAPTTGSYGIQVSSGSTGTDVIMNLEISGNNTTGGFNSGTGTTFPGIGLRKQGTDPLVNEFRIKGMPEGVTGTPGVENYVNSQNTSASGSFGTGGTALVSATTGFTNDTPPASSRWRRAAWRD